MMRTILALISLFLDVTVLHAAERSLNGKPLQLSDSVYQYSMLVTGHFYGSSNSSSGLPASTIVANVDRMNATGAVALLSTGDMFQSTQHDLAEYRRVLFQPLQMPIFNAVGNHDMDGEGYVEKFGSTFYSVELGQDILLVLDAEIDDSSIKGEQLDLLERSVDAMRTGRVRHMFILTHRPIWAEDDERYSGLFKNNTRSTLGTNFNDEVRPLLEEAAKYGSVAWFSGSLGGSAPFPIYIDSPLDRLHFFQSAVRDERKDAMLVVDVDERGIHFSAFSLRTGGPLDVKQFEHGSWSEGRGGPKRFQWRLVPYYVKSALTHRYFWWGALTVLLMGLAVRVCWVRTR